MKSKGAHVSLSPTVNIHRSVTNGRNFECYSEDPVLTAQLAGAFIAGLQEQGIGATIKHFAGNESEIERTSIDSMVDERALREVYLYPFEYAVKIAGTWGIMSSYNKLNGVFASENEWLLGQVLRHEWKYAGVVMSDWFGSHSTAPAINAGLDLEMPGPTRDRGQKLLDAVNAGEVSAATIQLRATNVLRLADRTGAIDDERSGDEHADDRQVHRALIRRAGAEAAVLLKNDGLLPLDPATLGKIAVIGPNAKVAQIMGGGSAQLNPHYAVSPWQGLEAKFGEDRLIFAPGATNQRFEPEAEQRDEETIAAAAAAARSAEVAIVCVGRNGEWDREGADLEDIRLPGRQDELVSAVARANPRTIVVLQTGGPVEMPWRDEVAAILEAWYPGQEAGNAIADVLTGAAEPGGRLPQSFPARWNDNPVHSQDREIYPGLNGRMRYEEGVFIGYRHYDRRGIAPMFPFGFGLSYTSFELTDLAIDASRFEAAGAVRGLCERHQHRRPGRQRSGAALCGRRGLVGAAAGQGAQGLRETGAGAGRDAAHHARSRPPRLRLLQCRRPQLGGGAGQFRAAGGNFGGGHQAQRAGAADDDDDAGGVVRRSHDARLGGAGAGPTLHSCGSTPTLIPPLKGEGDDCRRRIIRGKSVGHDDWLPSPLRGGGWGWGLCSRHKVCRHAACLAAANCAAWSPR